MYNTYIENVDEEFEIEVSYDYQPYEQMTRHYPGCSESVDINEVRIVDGPEICLMKNEESLIEEEILENIAEESNYNKYGYMLDEY